MLNYTVEDTAPAIARGQCIARLQSGARRSSDGGGSRDGRSDRAHVLTYLLTLVTLSPTQSLSLSGYFYFNIYLFIQPILLFLQFRKGSIPYPSRHRALSPTIQSFFVSTILNKTTVLTTLLKPITIYLYGISVKGALTLLFSSLLKAVATQGHKVGAVTRLVWIRSPLGGLNYNLIIFSFRLVIFSFRTSVTHYTQYLNTKLPC